MRGRRDGQRPDRGASSLSLAAGRRGTARLRVGTSDTALALGSGDVEVLATPRVVALCEAAACAAIEAGLDPGTTTVGTWIELEHVAATSLGREVIAEAELRSMEGGRLEFAVEVREGDRVVARGLHRRQLVDRARFLARLERAEPDAG